MFGLLQEALIIKINKVINSVLSEVLSFSPQNEVFNKNLQRLNGKLIKLQLNNLPSIFSNEPRQYYILFKNDEVSIKSTRNCLEQSYDLLINLSPYGLVSAKVHSLQKALQNGDLELSGDINLAMIIQLLFGNAEINLKDMLQVKLGQNFSDVFAWQFIKVLDKIFGIISEKKAEAVEQIVDYAQLEKNILVNKYEVDAYCQDIDKLHGDVERLAARVDLLGREFSKN